MTEKLELNVQAKPSSTLLMQLKKSRLEEFLDYLCFAVENENQNNCVGLICSLKVCYVRVSISPFAISSCSLRCGQKLQR